MWEGAGARSLRALHDVGDGDDDPDDADVDDHKEHHDASWKAPTTTTTRHPPTPTRPRTPTTATAATPNTDDAAADEPDHDNEFVSASGQGKTLAAERVFCFLRCANRTQKADCEKSIVVFVLRLRSQRNSGC